jgi:hypothetical protein
MDLHRHFSDEGVQSVLLRVGTVLYTFTVYTSHECTDHRVHIFRDETGLVCLPTQLERTLQLYW